MAYKKRSPIKGTEPIHSFSLEGQVFVPGIQTYESDLGNQGFGRNLTNEIGQEKGNREPWGPQTAPAGGVPFKGKKG